jgi:hypothetical protein
VRWQPQTFAERALEVTRASPFNLLAVIRRLAAAQHDAAVAFGGVEEIAANFCWLSSFNF